MLSALSAGGQYAFSAWVRIQGATSAPVEFAVTTTTEGTTPTDASLGSIDAVENDWVELSGNFGLGAAANATGINLKIYGPPTNVTLCFSDVRIRAMSPQ